MIMVSLAEGFVAAWACVRACRLHGMSIMGVVWFVLISYFIVHVKQNGREEITKKKKVISCVWAALFDLFYVIAERMTLTDGLESRMFAITVLIVCLAGFFVLLYYLLLFLFQMADKHSIKQRENGKKKHEKLWKYIPYISFLICLILWMPWFLYSYPGIMTPDSINQLEQVQHVIPYSNHHPVVHTMLIEMFYHLGYTLLGTANGGVACYVLFQMLFMAFSVAFLIGTIMKEQTEIGLPASVLVTCFYALMPYHAVLAVTVWKDGMFAAVVLIFSTLLYRLLKEDKVKWPEAAGYAVTALAFCLLRSNGWYAFLLLIPFLLFAFRKNKKLMIPLHAVILASVLMIKGPVMSCFGVGQPDLVESLCIPVQQIARVLVDDRELSEKDSRLIGQVIDTTYIKELYAPDFADNMKELVRAGDQQYLTDHKADYAKLYLRLLWRYPDEFFRAYVDQTYGYYDPGANYPVAEAEGIVDNRCGVYWSPLIRSGVAVKLREILIKLKNIVPVYGSLWNIGAAVWYSLILLGISLIRAEKIAWQHFVPFLPALAVIAVVLVATPVAADFRYAYSLFYTLPLMGYMAFKI